MWREEDVVREDMKAASVRGGCNGKGWLWRPLQGKEEKKKREASLPRYHDSGLSSVILLPCVSILNI